MKRSNTQSDFDIIHNHNHVEKVIKCIKMNFDKYFDKIVGINTNDGLGGLKAKLNWNEKVEEFLARYDKESKAYNDLFAEDSLNEYEEIDDPKTFKSDIKKECPIIRKTLNSNREELKEWQKDFAFADAREMYDTFLNFIDYARDYSGNINENNYEQLDKLEDFDGLHEFSTDPDLGMQKVIGAGIKTTILYHLDSRYFNRSVRKNLYGLYFLTDKLHERLPSRTSEFIMLDDTKKYKEYRGSTANFTIEHNYWYPYDLFMFYSKHIYDLLKLKLRALEIDLQLQYRYVYVTMFLELITNEHKEVVQTMMGGDQRDI